MEDDYENSYDYDGAENYSSSYGDALICYKEFPEKDTENNKETEKVEVNSAGECISNNLNNDNKENVEMICDSGATEHMVNSTKFFSKIFNLTKLIKINSANSKAPINATKKGSFISRLDNGKIFNVNQILFAEKLTKNLLTQQRPYGI